ncbi:MAG TPA: hypothetical protein VIY49_12435 [Bryobacteraceae bacterium]
MRAISREWFTAWIAIRKAHAAGRLGPHRVRLSDRRIDVIYALANMEQNLKIPALAFAEWGPGDVALSLGVLGGNVNDPRMVAARSKVFAAVKANHMFFLNSCNANNVVDMIK